MNVLLVTTAATDSSALSDGLREAIGDDDATVRVVAPATKISRLDWLTNDEDAARSDARRAADSATEAVETSSVEVDRTSHDTDAAQAVADALRTFAADEIVVVTRSGDESTWLDDAAVDAALEASGLPVRRVVLAASD